MHYSRLAKIVIIIAFLALVCGCANTPHNDVLIFGTNTKVAFDVSADPANSGTPNVTLGYTRLEIAWVPLRANGILVDEDGKPMSDITAKGRKYIGMNEKQQDAYSVFASFGGSFSGGGAAKAGLSQFFATGIAAQNLGKNPTAANMVSVQPVDAKVLEKQEQISALEKSLGEEKVAKYAAEQKKKVSDRQAKAAVIAMQVPKNPDGSINKTRLEKVIKDAKVKTPWDTLILKMTTPKALNSFLVDHVEDDAVDSLYEALK
jgi:hypothetical protein